jgi:hypothetical protein
MGDMPYGQCKYCHQIGPLRITYFRIPIDCNCCGNGHSERIEHCNNCDAEMPTVTTVCVYTKKLFDPIHEGLFKKVRE